MKDEEMAKKWVEDNKYGIDEYCLSIEDFGEHGFLAGLKVGRQDDQLIKAKEIIRTFLNMPMPNNEEVFADVGIFLAKAEQFLKEIK